MAFGYDFGSIQRAQQGTLDAMDDLTRLELEISRKPGTLDKLLDPINQIGRGVMEEYFDKRSENRAQQRAIDLKELEARLAEEKEAKSRANAEADAEEVRKRQAAQRYSRAKFLSGLRKASRPESPHYREGRMSPDDWLSTPEGQAYWVLKGGSPDDFKQVKELGSARETAALLPWKKEKAEYEVEDARLGLLEKKDTLGAKVRKEGALAEEAEYKAETARVAAEWAQSNAEQIKLFNDLRNDVERGKLADQAAERQVAQWQATLTNNIDRGAKAMGRIASNIDLYNEAFSDTGAVLDEKEQKRLYAAVQADLNQANIYQDSQSLPRYTVMPDPYTKKLKLVQDTNSERFRELEGYRQAVAQNISLIAKQEKDSNIRAHKIASAISQLSGEESLGMDEFQFESWVAGSLMKDLISQLGPIEASAVLQKIANLKDIRMRNMQKGERNKAKTEGRVLPESNLPGPMGTAPAHSPGGIEALWGLVAPGY